MELQSDKELCSALCSVITEQAHELTIGGRRLYLYPLTLAKTLVLRPWLDELSIDASLLRLDPYSVCLRSVSEFRSCVVEVLSIYTLPNRRDSLYDPVARDERRKLLGGVKDSHLAGLLMGALCMDLTDELLSGLGIAAERARLHRVLSVKGEDVRQTQSFGGKSLLGSFIVPLLELGFRSDEVVFERSYSYLRLLLADKVTSVYLSEEELERLPVSDGGTLLDGSDSGDLDKLSEQIRRGGVRKS